METLFGIDYPTWWFLVVGFLFSGYAILDGFDFGAGTWHLFLKEEHDKRLSINAIGPVWDGNEVWLIIGGGALFAGFPVMYATFFSALYIPFMLFLAFLIFRAVAIEFRNKEDNVLWHKIWDIFYGVSSAVLAVLLGVVLGNLLQGIAVGKAYVYTGSGFFEFLNPYALLTGLTTLALFLVHGNIYLLLKTEGELFKRLHKFSMPAVLLFIILFALLTLYSWWNVPYLLDVFKKYPVTLAFPVLTFLSVANIPRLVTKKRFASAFLFSSLTIAFLLMLVAAGLYPNLLLSTVDAKYNLDIYQAASSLKSLKIMMIIVAIGTPLIAFYTFFVYKTFYGKVKLDDTDY